MVQQSETCTFDCLTSCPSPGNCYYDDPIGEPIHYHPHQVWRWDHGNLVCPDPEDPTTFRCPRCYSTDVGQNDRYVWCNRCGFNETQDTTNETDGSDWL